MLPALLKASPEFNNEFTDEEFDNIFDRRAIQKLVISKNTYAKEMFA